MRLRFGAPAAANARMENFFERGFSVCARKDYGAKCRPIQVAARGKDFRPELTRDFVFYLRVKIDKFTCSRIRVEKFRIGQKLAQTIAESRFARGNSAGDPDGGHVIFCWWR